MLMKFGCKGWHRFDHVYFPWVEWGCEDVNWGMVVVMSYLRKGLLTKSSHRGNINPKVADEYST